MEVLQEFLESSTIHGLSHISTAKVGWLKETLSIETEYRPIKKNINSLNKRRQFIVRRKLLINKKYLI
jgi:hypothetical protein